MAPIQIEFKSPLTLTGSIGAAMHLQNLQKHGITHIVCCIDKAFKPFEDASAKTIFSQILEA